jgi:hypothetical protein
LKHCPFFFKQNTYEITASSNCCNMVPFCKLHVTKLLQQIQQAACLAPSFVTTVETTDCGKLSSCCWLQPGVVFLSVLFAAVSDQMTRHRTTTTATRPLIIVSAAGQQ